MADGAPRWRDQPDQVGDPCHVDAGAGIVEADVAVAVLGEQHGSEALKRITWHGVRTKARRPDYSVTDGQMKGCFIKGKKAFVENAVMGIREK